MKGFVCFLFCFVSLLCGAICAFAQSSLPPLSEADIIGALRDGSGNKYMISQVNYRGVDFALTPEIEQQLHKAGADKDLINAIHKAKIASAAQPVAPAQTPVPITAAPSVSVPAATAPSGSPMLLINADSDCTVNVNGGASFDMKAGETRRVPAMAGDNIVQAIGKGTGGTWRRVIRADGTEQRAVLIDLQGVQQEQAIRSAAPTTRANSTDGLTYIWIAPGTFQMGCSRGDNDCFGPEKPPHAVTISKGFWIGQTPVTQAAYLKVMGRNPSHFHGEKLPVEEVSWDDARAYCGAVGLRLPTEAEWEYAARAGTTSVRPGDLDQIAWYDQNSNQQTHEVAQKQPNAWRLYDMLGNVWEWTNDWYDAGNYAGVPAATSPVLDPRGPQAGGTRVMRGGSWEDTARFVRVSERSSADPGSSDDLTGFRCAGDMPQAAMTY